MILDKEIAVYNARKKAEKKFWFEKNLIILEDEEDANSIPDEYEVDTNIIPIEYEEHKTLQY